MTGRRTIALAVLVAVVGACGNSSSPSPSTAAGSASPSPSAAVIAAGSLSAESSASTTPSSSVAATPTPRPTATPVPTPAPTPVPWKTFTSKRYHYKMSYPPDWVVTPGNAQYQDQFDSFGYPYIYVTRDTVTNQVSVSITVNGEIAYMKSHYKAKLVSNKGIKLASGYSGRLLTFTGVEQGLKVTIQLIVVAKGRVGYFISLFADSRTADQDRGLFRKMYLTWRPTP